MNVITFDDLPYDVIRIILRIVILGPNIPSYFCVNKTFNYVLNSMCKKYTKPNKFYCIVCYKSDCLQYRITKGRTRWCGGIKTQIFFDNVCEDCLRTAKSKTCNQCHINFMSTFLGKPEKTLCENCYDNKEKHKLVVCQKKLLVHTHTNKHSCVECDCTLVSSYYDFVSEKRKTICPECYDKIGKKLIVIPNGFPYEINTYCPTK